jgi:hypothetical protein
MYFAAPKKVTPKKSRTFTVSSFVLMAASYFKGGGGCVVYLWLFSFQY